MEKRYFGTDGIRGQVGLVPITPEFSLKLGWAIGQVLCQRMQQKPSILIGRDTRLSGQTLESALIAGLLTAGVRVQCVGILPTPSLAYLIKYYNTHAGIMVTASHNPYTDNGFKFFTQQGQKLTTDIQDDIENKLHQPIQITNIAALGTVQIIENAQDQYLSFCQKTVPEGFSLAGKKIVLDCAHGATYQLAPQLFQSLGAQTISTNIQPNGLNINLQCGSLHPENLQKRVLQEQASMGIAFDGDGDRVIMVDHTGNIYNGDDLLFILAKTHLKNHHTTSNTVVGTIMSNHGLEVALHKIDINLLRTPVGDHHIYNALSQTHNVFGSEPSGHIICRNITPAADALIAALQVLLALEGRSLQEACIGFKRFPQYTLNIPVMNAEKILETTAIHQARINATKELAAFEGRLILRASGTEPVIRIMVEGSQLPPIQHIAKKLAQTVLDTAQKIASLT